MSKIVMGYWTCNHCKTTGITGTDDNCPHCGSGKDKNIRYYMDPENPAYLVDKKNHGPDWYCVYCGLANKAERTTCDSCGADRNKKSKNYFEATGRNQNQIFREKSDFKEEPLLELKPSIEAASALNLFIDTMHKLMAPVFAIITAVLMLFFIFQIFQPKLQTLEIYGYEWEREIQIEELRTVRENDWHLPVGGVLISTQEEIHHYDSVLDYYETKTRTYTEQVFDGYDTVVSGYSDNGNGTFSEVTTQIPTYRTETRVETYQEPIYRQEAVYQTKYYYDIDRWMYAWSSFSSGVDNQPYWNEPELGSLERISKSKERYTIRGTNEKDQTKEYVLDFDKWDELRINGVRQISVFVDILGNITFPDNE